MLRFIATIAMLFFYIDLIIIRFVVANVLVVYLGRPSFFFQSIYLNSFYRLLFSEVKPVRLDEDTVRDIINQELKLSTMYFYIELVRIVKRRFGVVVQRAWLNIAIDCLVDNLRGLKL